MQLLTLDEVRARLEDLAEQHSSLSELFRLPAAACDPEVIATCFRQIGVNPPNSFSEIVLKYDFGSFTLGFVAFGHTGDYFSELAKWNGENWWGAGQRPGHLVVVGIGDPCAILLDVSTGAISAIDEDRHWKRALPVASDFELFLRGMGTMMFCEDRTKILGALTNMVGGDEAFWKHWCN
jgi:hypothetical protein